MIDRDERDTGQQPFSVVIAGGGIAGVEAAFALHELAGDQLAVTVLSAREDLVYRPLAIGEPFNRGQADHYELATLATEAGAEFVRGTLAHVDAEARIARTVDGAELTYDALLVAVGATIEPVYEHATTVDDAHMDELLHGLVQDIEEGYLHRLAIIVPAPMPWPLPGYELALMASERAWDMQVGLDITLLTPERMALEMFGRRGQPRGGRAAGRAPVLAAGGQTYLNPRSALGWPLSGRRTVALTRSRRERPRCSP